MIARAQLLIVTGYLGAGKTTLLKSLRTTLGNDTDCRIIVNEAGEVALDQASYTIGGDDTVVVSGGCACCTRRSALVAGIRDAVETLDRTKPGWIVVETSGLANPAPILFSVLDDELLKHHVQIAGVVAAVGAEEGEAAVVRRPEAQQQLAMADAVILTKTDRVNEAKCQRLVSMLSGRSADIPIFLVGHKSLRWMDLLTTLTDSARSTGKTSAMTPELPSNYEQHQNITPCVISIARSVDWQVFGIWLSALLAEHGESIVRVKGVIPVQDWNDDVFHVLINGVQHVVYPPEHVTDQSRLPNYPALIFFLRGIDQEQIKESFGHFLDRFSDLSP